MSSWMKLYPSKEQLKLDPYKQVFEEVHSKITQQNEPKIKEEQKFFVPQYKKPDNKIYAQALKQQMQNNFIKQNNEKTIYKSAEIPEDNKIYPNRPQTPKQVRRQIELEKMQKLKIDLEGQITEKKIKNQSKNNVETELIKNLLLDDNEKLKILENNIAKHKETEKSTLLESWSQAVNIKYPENSTNNSLKNSFHEGYSKSNFNQNNGKKIINSSTSNTINPININNFDMKSKNNMINKDNYSRNIFKDNLNNKFYEEKIKKILDSVKKTNIMDESRRNQSVSENTIIKGGRKHFKIN